MAWMWTDITWELSSIPWNSWTATSFSKRVDVRGLNKSSKWGKGDWVERGRGDGVLLFLFIYLFNFWLFYIFFYILFIFLVTIYNRNFYTPAQYVGALIVLGGLVVSVLPAFLNSKTSNAGPPMFDLVSPSSLCFLLLSRSSSTPLFPRLNL